MKKWIVSIALLTITAIPQLFARANAPIQRIDVVNLLSNGGGVTQTSVVVAFANEGSLPCFTATLAFRGTITVWAGTGQACVNPITDVTITPIAASSEVPVVYEPPPLVSINATLYSTQLLINQNTAPIFDTTNGTLIATGTILTTALSHVAN